MFSCAHYVTVQYHYGEEGDHIASTARTNHVFPISYPTVSCFPHINITHDIVFCVGVEYVGQHDV